MQIPIVWFCTNKLSVKAIMYSFIWLHFVSFHQQRCAKTIIFFMYRYYILSFLFSSAFSEIHILPVLCFLNRIFPAWCKWCFEIIIDHYILFSSIAALRPIADDETESPTEEDEGSACSVGYSQKRPNALRLRQNGCHFADNIFKCTFLNEIFCILIQISLKFVPEGPIDSK